ncbi:hypothetical protein DP116_08180 [Brasilonema bromeliae SPC951]|uniref:Uncharacterized protein n=1 Tax=Brasilonema bromeliae SPC951 TaxID=385972 RepID=A0ABX1P523_9CYAN|nr:hypothetical protein [Brasilonema bromeliae SPC951]
MATIIMDQSLLPKTELSIPIPHAENSRIATSDTSGYTLTKQLSAFICTVGATSPGTLVEHCLMHLQFKNFKFVLTFEFERRQDRLSLQLINSKNKPFYSTN